MQKPAFDPGLTQQYTGNLRRAINKDGTFNVRRRGATWRDFHPYLHLIGMGWIPFFGLLFLGYLVVNTLFALGYFWLGPGQLQGQCAPPGRHMARLPSLSALDRHGVDPILRPVVSGLPGGE